MSSSSQSDVEPHILKKFKLVRRIGKGAYGVVYKAVDRATKQTVALKKIFDAFRNATDAQRTFREVMFLRQIHHENVVKLFEVIPAQNDKDLYLVFEYLDTDLHAAIRANILQDVHIRYVVYQLLRSLKYLHSGKLIHRDLKPSNLFLNADCHVKLGDFGLARCLEGFDKESDANPVLTDYVATRWYRAPEILVGSTKYTYGVDMWAVGCILGELLKGKPMFTSSSSSTLKQLERIIEVTGFPSPADIEGVGSPFLASMLEGLPSVKRRKLEHVLPGAPPDGLDLLAKLLVFDPDKRISADDALKHPYIAKFHSSDEPVMPKPVQIFIDDDVKFSVSTYREYIYKEFSGKVKDKKDREKDKK
ncbi:Kinase, CMGC MAPK [Aduncisulcus paluster]|uniref:Mitogen-activated protein kinase n=1 Tax=Aduncisulcus paluster TaxID=2918883 RepID=A0ABQ5KKZ9_9EUKA|nr:Kinase, CMGC MAPK [Aduncisulcus paluster]